MRQSPAPGHVTPGKLEKLTNGSFELPFKANTLYAGCIDVMTCSSFAKLACHPFLLANNGEAFKACKACIVSLIVPLCTMMAKSCKALNV